MLLSHGVTPILVFDGRHLPSKLGTETKRREYSLFKLLLFNQETTLFSIFLNPETEKDIKFKPGNIFDKATLQRLENVSKSV